ncbi:MAG TPA: hypothetical protein VF210_01300 [Pseudomonadales bacterium]
MNKLLLLGLIGGGMYWLFRQSGQPAYLEEIEGEHPGTDSDVALTQADHEQRLLDEALEESFPASDPISPSTGGQRPEGL